MGERCLPFVRSTVETLLKQQSARLGGEPDATPFITVSMPTFRAWTSIGIWLGDRYQLIDVPARALQMQATALDFGAWPVLDKLSAATGDPRYGEMVERMAAAFVPHGFDPASGLILDGSMFRFDVVRREPVATSVWGAPSFKPGGPMPWERLWTAAPDAMARFCKATFYGLVTRPETMDFNRYVAYGFDDGARRHVTAFHPMHRGFVYAAAMLVDYWAMHFARTGDPETLAWARAMTDKWLALRHPDTGLLPHFIGAIDKDETAQPPTPYANLGDSTTSVIFLAAAERLASRDEGAALARQVRDLGVRSLRGIARHGYDPERRLFPSWIRLEGGEYTDQAFYCFRTQGDKDAALERDPAVESVDVFPGARLFTQGPQSVTAGVRLPVDVARGAAMTGDPELTERARFFADEIMSAARVLTGPLNAQGQWVFPALGQYVSAMVALHRATGETEHLARAEELAGIALRLLEETPCDEAEWCRLPARSAFLEALLDLAIARQAGR